MIGFVDDRRTTTVDAVSLINKHFYNFTHRLFVLRASLHVFNRQQPALHFLAADDNHVRDIFAIGIIQLLFYFSTSRIWIPR